MTTNSHIPRPKIPRPKKKGKLDYHRKFDVSDALRLRLSCKLSYAEIAKQFGVSKQAIFERLKPFEEIIKDADVVDAYEKNKASLLSSAELVLLKKILDPSTLAKGSLNNAAYTYTQLFNSNRLTTGKSTANMDVQQTVSEIKNLELEYELLRKQLPFGMESASDEENTEMGA